MRPQHSSLSSYSATRHSSPISTNSSPHIFSISAQQLCSTLVSRTRSCSQSPVHADNSCVTRNPQYSISYPVKQIVSQRFRSEERTSERQSRGHLVCRLL